MRISFRTNTRTHQESESREKGIKTVKSEKLLVERETTKTNTAF